MAILSIRKALQARTEAVEEVPEPELPRQATRRPRATLAKMNNPLYKAFNHYLRMDTVADARLILDRQKMYGTQPEGVYDLSDLVGHLMVEWVERERKAVGK